MTNSQNTPESLTLDLDPAELLAASLFAAKKDIRFYLRGICLSINSDGMPHITATDGNRLIDIWATIDPSNGNGLRFTESANTQAIIPIEAFKPIKLSKRDTPRAIVTLSEPVATGWRFARFSIKFCGMEWSGETIDGKFPDFERVIPASTDGTLADYQPDYLQDAQKALNLLGFKYEGIYQNGTGAGILATPDHLRIVVMPWKSQSAGKTYPPK